MDWVSVIGFGIFLAGMVWYAFLAVVIVLVIWNTVGEWVRRRFRGKGHYASDYLAAGWKPYLKRRLDEMEARGEFMWRPRSRRND